MPTFRLTHSAQADIANILQWSRENFGDDAAGRYAALITAAIRDAAERSSEVGFKTHPELGHGTFTWHLTQSRHRATGRPVNRPRHMLLCRREGEVLIIGRVLHEAMVPRDPDWQ